MSNIAASCLPDFKPFFNALTAAKSVPSFFTAALGSFTKLIFALCASFFAAPAAASAIFLVLSATFSCLSAIPVSAGNMLVARVEPNSMRVPRRAVVLLAKKLTAGPKIFEKRLRADFARESKLAASWS